MPNFVLLRGVELSARSGKAFRCGSADYLNPCVACGLTAAAAFNAVFLIAMSQDVRQRAFGATVAAAAIERLFEPRRGGGFAPRPRFLAFLALCLLLHVVILAILLREDALTVFRAPQSEEIPVEVIVEPPPAPEAQPPAPEPPKPEEQPKEQPPQKPPTPTIDEKPAIDAPRAESKEKSDRDAPEKELKAPRVAPPPKEIAPKDDKPQAREDGRDNALGVERAPEKQADDKPDAEIVERAEPLAKPEQKPEPEDQKPAAKKGQAKSIADQIAALAPLPDFEFGAPPKPSPVGGGHAKTTYLTILYGLIMPHMHIPPRVRSNQFVAKGVVAFYIDEMGNLTHQAVYRSSGAPDLDAAALAAVRRASPFPPPPRGLPHAMLFTYATK